jgi:hypothetical protein
VSNVLSPLPVESLDLAPVECAQYPPSTALLCAPDVICGQWLCGEARSVDTSGWGPVVCEPLDLVPLACEEA